MMKKTLLVLGSLMTVSALSADFNLNFQRQYEVEEAKKLFQKGQYKQAYDKFQELAASAPSAEKKAQTRAWAARALARREDRYEDAIKLAQSIEEKPYAVYAQMKIMTHKRKYKTLAETFGDVDIAAWPEDMINEGFYLRGCAYRRSGQDTQAGIRDFEQCMERIDPHNRHWAHSAMWLGGLYTKNGEDDKALQSYRDALAVFNKGINWTGGSYHAQTVMKAIGVLEKQKKYEEAIQLINDQNVKDKWLGNMWWRRAVVIKAGDIYAKMDKPDQAVAEYKKAIEYNEKYTDNPERHNKRLKEKIEKIKQSTDDK